MKRFTPTIVVLGLLASAACAQAAADAAPRAELRNLQCVRALDPPARAVSITAVMRSLPGTRRLQMKVELLDHTAAGAPFSAVSPPSGSALGAWIGPTAPTLGQRPADVWQVKFPVADLAAPATYRYRARFRWLGTGGHVLRTTTVLSARCRQPELRADLLVQSLSVQPFAGHPQQARYVAVIRNAGESAARNFVVGFSDAGTIRTVTVAELAPGAKQRLTFTGPPCNASNPPALTIDPQNQVDDSNRGNNTATAGCA
jgi:hypothetical protein